MALASDIGLWSWKIYTRYYARFGEWPRGLMLILGGHPVPEHQQFVGDQFRKMWLEKQLERALMDVAPANDGLPEEFAFVGEVFPGARLIKVIPPEEE